MVDHRSILGHHRVEQLQAVTDAGQLEEGPSRDEDQSDPHPPSLLERSLDLWFDAVLDRQSAVEVACERLERDQGLRLARAAAEGNQRRSARCVGR